MEGEVERTPAEVQEFCLKKFSQPDYIMEIGIFHQLKWYNLTPNIVFIFL